MIGIVQLRLTIKYFILFLNIGCVREERGRRFVTARTCETDSHTCGGKSLWLFCSAALRGLRDATGMVALCTAAGGKGRKWGADDSGCEESPPEGTAKRAAGMEPTLPHNGNPNREEEGGQRKEANCGGGTRSSKK
ncbi:hypothetical protein C8J57DRAFT_1226275 [Mycena rebaudengoi]|nr:hypothetical protein C8J57DRAFT_1226275 [Mycena rebaudengoi]